MRYLLLWPAFLGAQTLSVGRALSPNGQLLSIDTVFRFEKAPAYLYIQYRVPAGYERDTFMLLVRNALGPLTWISLPPSRSAAPFRHARLQLGKSGVYGLFIYAKAQGNRVWAFKRIYVILPPYQTLAQVKAYHNALLAKSSQKPSTPPLDSPPLPEPPDDPVQKALPTSETVELPPSEEETFLPDDIQLLPQDGVSDTPFIEDEDSLDEP